MQNIKSSRTLNFYSKTNYGVLVNGVNINRPNCVVLKVQGKSLVNNDFGYGVSVRFACNGKVGSGVIYFETEQEAGAVLVGYNFHLDSMFSFKLVK